MKVRLKDIARELGLSESAVSMALNGKKGVSRETRIAVEKAAAELGYMPDAIARSLAKRKSKTIGLVVPDIENPYYAKMVRCIDACVRETGYTLSVAISNEDINQERERVFDFASRQVEGIIVAPINRSANSFVHYELMRRRKLPVVFIAARYTPVELPYVMVNLEMGFYTLVNYLLKSGHRNIIFLTGQPDNIASYLRIEGYKRAYRHNDLAYRDEWFVTCPTLDYDQAYRVTSQLIADRYNLDTIITVNDYMALGVLKALYEKGVAVPGDVSVAGCDDIVYASIANVPVTTVVQDIQLMSRISVDMLLDMIRNRTLHTDSRMLDPELIVRESTRS